MYSGSLNSYFFLLILAVEGKAILDGLAGRNNAKAFQVILNGHSIPLSALKRRLVYVRSQSFLSPDLNVAQTLTFYSHLRRPPKHSIKVTTSEQVRFPTKYNSEFRRDLTVLDNINR